MPAPEFIPPTPFPTRAFVAIGVVWVVLDLLELAVSFVVPTFAWRSGFLVYILTLSIWGPLFCAKVMLMLGWWFLGEGPIGQRIAGVLLFLPLLVFALMTGVDNVILGFVGTLVSIPLAAFYVGIPFLLINAAEFRLRRDTPHVVERHHQFTVRQLMVVTFSAAVVMGLLRGTHELTMWHSAFAIWAMLLAWVYPAIAALGLLRAKWYPGVLYTAGITIYLIALPFMQSDLEPVKTYRPRGLNNPVLE